MRLSRRAEGWWGLGLLVAAAALGYATMLHGIPFAIDTWWAGVLADPPPGARLAFSLLLDEVGGGWWAILVVPLAAAAVLLIRRRRAGALYFALATAASAALVQLLKALFGRERPEDILVIVDEGSFPSGHVANAATVVFALWMIVDRWWMAAIAVVWTLSMAFARTYLSAHWASDTLGGALIGVGVALVLAALLHAPLDAEEQRLRALRG
ncbi:phosphatase PAP2 family protein [Microbacterium gilvum]|uniref:Phosphatidic acid phosphatase type 2/haloperoxidase domain-containing protein n=1 Tax=Microbacterium gilvum TaxID=1336204 RepID=A0ABP9AJK7_9MICO